MKYLVALALYLSIGVALAATDSHLIVISIDGLRPEVYLHPEREKLRVPNLIALRDRGVAAERMIGIFPTVTYPSHATLVTGTNPVKHKIGTNFIRGTTNWHLNAADIQSETLWQAYRKAGLTTAIVTWPMTYGADVDWLIPENLSSNMADAVDHIKAGATPGLFSELERQVGRFSVPPYNQADAFERLDEMTAAYAAYIMRHHHPNLLLIHFLDADHKQHAFSPRSSQAGRAFEKIDSQIGSILKGVSDAGFAAETNIVVLGDHGFSPVNTGVNITQILASIGYAKIENQKSETRVVDAMSSGGSIALYAKPGVSMQDVYSFDTKLSTEITKNYRGVLTYVPKSKLEQLGGYPDAVAALMASPGYLFLEAPESRVMLPMPGLGGHGYDPNVSEMATGFIAAGPAFREHFRLSLIHMLDIAPTLAAINKVPFPHAEGAPIRSILRTP